MQWSCTFGPWGHSRVVITHLCSFLAFVFFFPLFSACSFFWDLSLLCFVFLPSSSSCPSWWDFLGLKSKSCMTGHAHGYGLVFILFLIFFFGLCLTFVKRSHLRLDFGGPVCCTICMVKVLEKVKLVFQLFQWNVQWWTGWVEYIHREYLTHCEQPKEQGICQYTWPSAIQDPTAAGTDGQSVHIMCHVGFNDIPFLLVEERRSCLWLVWVSCINWSQVCMCQVDLSLLALHVLRNYSQLLHSHQCHQ